MPGIYLDRQVLKLWSLTRSEEGQVEKYLSLTMKATNVAEAQEVIRAHWSQGPT